MPTIAAAAFALLLAACAADAPQAQRPQQTVAASPSSAQSYLWLNRMSWGATSSLFAQQGRQSQGAYLEAQLKPVGDAARLPAAVQSQIDAMTITQQPLMDLVQTLEQQRKDADATTGDEEKKTAQQNYQKELNRIGREAATRHVLRALYSPTQVREQMTWFWLNHFNVFQYKANVRVLLGDYEDKAIRAHAQGRFRDLLGAVVYHPAMLKYLDNDQNAAGRINENFARELMELHTLGVDGGYAQRDVQELARVLTGVGVNQQLPYAAPKLKPELQGLYVRRGLFEFNPARHDFGDKQLLGQPMHARGLAEVDEALDRLSRHPSTARFISRKLAQYWLSDEPPQRVVDLMSQTFLRTDGDIAEVLRTLFTSTEFAQGGHKFKDPMRYVISSVRLAYDDKPILNAGPVLNWLSRMGEPLYGHQTPDGYPLGASAWASPGQMTTRFEVAKSIASGSAGLFKTEGPQPVERAAFPQLANALYYQAMQQTLSDGTRRALDQAASPQEWNTFLLSSPEMMVR